MTKNFSKIKKDLKSFAKRIKDFKYTDRILVVFLMTGSIGIKNNSFSAQTSDIAIQNQINQINTSVINFRKQLKETKNKNNESIKHSNLELIQLMEQGDHVIKPNWSSWQFGNSYQYNNWNGFYKGKGNKLDGHDRIFTRDKNIFNRNVSPLSNRYNLVTSNLRGSSYGNTQIKEMEEPVVEWEVSAGINPRRVEKIAPLAIVSRSRINFENPEMPVFEVPDGDVIVSPAPAIPNNNPSNHSIFLRWDNRDYSNIKKESNQLLIGNTGPTGVFSQTNINGINGKGKLEVIHNGTEKFTVETNNATFTGIEGSAHNLIFSYNGDIKKKYKYLDDNATTGVRLGGGHNFEIENMDISSSGNLADSITNGVNTYRTTFNIFQVDASSNSNTTVTLKESSSVVVDTSNTTAVFLFPFNYSSKSIKFLNKGTIKARKKYSSVVFPINYYNNTVSNFTNEGDIILDDKYADVLLDTAPTITIAHYIFINNKNIKLTGTNNRGIDIISLPRTGDPISIIQLNKPIVIEGNDSRGINLPLLSRRRKFEETVNGNLEKSFFNVEMYGENNVGMSIGIGSSPQSGEVKFKNFKLKSIDGKKNTLLGINGQNDIKFLESGDNKELTIEGGENNIALNIQKSTGMVNEGVITIKESTNGASINSTGIVSSLSNVENKGKINISGDRVKALYAMRNGKIDNHGQIIFNGTTTQSDKGSIGVYANYGGEIKSDETSKIIVSKSKSVGLFAENKGDRANYLNTSKIKISKAEITATEGAFNIFANKGGEIQLENGVVLNTGKDSLAFYTAYTPSNPGGKIIFDRDVTANIKKSGTAFYYDLANAPVGTFNFASWYSNNFSHNNNSKLKLNMENGGRVMFLANGNLTLSSIPTNLTATGPIEITGSGYISAAMVNSFLELDQNINLDNVSDPYNTLEILGSSITNSKNITGNKNKQLGIAQENNGSNPASKIKLINSNKITLTGEESIGIYGKRSEITNNGNISVGKNSVGVYLAEDNRGTAAGKAYNNGLITLEEGSSGMLYRADTTGANSALAGGIYNNSKIISNSKNAIGMNFESPHGSKEIVNETTGIIELRGENSVGMYASGTGNYTVKNLGKISAASSSSSNSPVIAIYTNNGNSTVENGGTIVSGDKSLGIYGYSVNTHNTSNISVGKAGTGIYSQGGNLNLQGKLTVGTDEAKGVLVTGNNQIVNNNLSAINLDSNSFGFINTGNNNQIISNTQNVSLKNQNIFLYSEKSTGNIINNTKIKTIGNQNYGIYTAGTASNNAEIDLTQGAGNVGVYSMGQQNVSNFSTIKVGESKVQEKLYSIGMAAGYYDIDNNISVYTGKIENTNTGKIEVTGKNGIGMYAVGRGSVAINNGEIHLSGRNSIGMFVDQEAVGINNGLITSTADAVGAIGAVATNRAIFKNYGTINILPQAGVGVLLKKDGILEEYSSPSATVAQKGSSRITAEARIKTPQLSKTGKELADGSVEIISLSGDSIPEIKINRKVINPVEIDVDTKSSGTKIIRDGNSVTTVSDTESNNQASNGSISKIGMYIDTSGVKYTNPIQGLDNLSDEIEVDLIIGTEATKYTNSKAIKIKENILEPYNYAILSNPQIKKWHIYSGSLTWMGTVQTDLDSEQLKSVYLVKVPYTSFAKDRNVYNFSDGLEQRYSMNTLNSMEKVLFDKLNNIGKNESLLLTQAFDEMMGHQYSNVQQRTYETGKLIDKEISNLFRGWGSPTKQSNKINVFGTKDEYNTNTAGIVNYKNSAYGVTYVHENEKIKMGNSSGWYVGAVTNKFKFKDIGKSKENQTMLKFGIFKIMSPNKDYNGALQWTVSGDVFTGINSMKRRFLVVNDIFEAKSTYNSYGAAVKNELGYDIRMSERMHLRPYGAVKMEYGKFNDIKEKNGQIRLEIRGNDYFSVRPETGIEFKYIQPLALKTNLSIGLIAAYENEIGKIQNGNQARVGYTTAGWYDLEKEKEDKRGNGKFDLNIRLNNTRFGFNLNAGYDTKGKNVRSGIGFRIIY